MKTSPGRKLTAKQTFWLEHLRRWQGSGETLSAYAAGHGLSRQAAYCWKARLRARGLFAERPEVSNSPSPRRQPARGPSVPVRDLKFIAARVGREDDEQQRAQPGLRIRFPNGIVLEVGPSCLGALESDLATRLAALS